MKASRLLAVAGLTFGITPLANALDFVADNIPYVQYGDGHSYSLPISQFIDGCTGPGCDYYVSSTPGAIQDLIVLGTGSSGTQVTTNEVGMDGAYDLPNAAMGDTFASTQLDPDPNDANDDGINNDHSVTWDSSLSALQGFLAGEEMLFFFNNNQENSLGTAAQSLAAWAQLWITDDTGGLIGHYEFTNDNSPYALVSEGGGGIPSQMGGDATNYSSGIANAADDSAALANNPDGNTNSDTDYVLSGGAICLDALNVPVSCSSATAVTGPINHNLGANEVAYGVLFPELNAQLASLFGNAALDLSQYTLHVDFRFGCDEDLFGVGASSEEICTGDILGHGKNLTDGFEQLFIGTTSSVVNVPTPGTLALLALGLLGIGSLRCRASKK